MKKNHNITFYAHDTFLE